MIFNITQGPIEVDSFIDMECRVLRNNTIPPTFNVDLSIIAGREIFSLNEELLSDHTQVKAMGSTKAIMKYHDGLASCQVNTKSGRFDERKIRLHIYRKSKHKHWLKGVLQIKI